MSSHENAQQTHSSTIHPPFKLERYFDEYEHHVKHLACASDCEALTINQVLHMATPSQREAWNNLKLSYTHTRGECSALYIPMCIC